MLCITNIQNNIDSQGYYSNINQNQIHGDHQIKTNHNNNHNNDNNNNHNSNNNPIYSDALLKKYGISRGENGLLKMFHFEKYDIEQKLHLIAGILSQRADNEHGDLLVYENDLFCNRYKALQVLGKGTFGEVIRCQDIANNNNQQQQYAIKIIRNKPAYHKQAKTEIKILQMLTKLSNEHIVPLLSYFEEYNHLFLVFPLLHINLYQLIKQNSYSGFNTSAVRLILIQLLSVLYELKEYRIIHTDLKPENILLENDQTLKIRVIDFGSACFEGQKGYSYIQSRFYRAPEVVLGCQYNCAIDMWSVGCIAAELSIGLPIFPGKNECTLLHRIVSLTHDLPVELLEQGTRTHRFYHKNPITNEYVLKTPAEYTREYNTEVINLRRYFLGKNLAEVILCRHVEKFAITNDEMYRRAMLVDFLNYVFEHNPAKRIIPSDALKHPFITGQQWHGPNRWIPPSLSQQNNHCININNNNDDNKSSVTLIKVQKRFK